MRIKKARPLILCLHIFVILLAVWIVANYPTAFVTYMFWYIVFVCLWAYFDGLYRHLRVGDADKTISARMDDSLGNDAFIGRICRDYGVFYDDDDFRFMEAQRLLVEFKKS